MAFFPSGGYVGDSYVGGPKPPVATLDPALQPASSTLPLREQLMGNLSGALRGELPRDVSDLIRSRAAEFGVASGMPGSELAANQGLRTLGLTSLNRMQGAEQMLSPLLFPREFTTPGYRDTTVPPQPRDPWFHGGGTPPLAQPAQGGIPRTTTPGPTAGTGNTGIGDELAQYLTGFSRGTAMNPMGSNSSSYFNPMELGSNPSKGVPFLGTAQNLGGKASNLLSNEELADLGLIDPLFGVDVNNFDSPDAGYLAETGAGYFDEG